MIIPSNAKLLKTHFELNVAETIDRKEKRFNENGRGYWCNKPSNKKYRYNII